MVMRMTEIKNRADVYQGFANTIRMCGESDLVYKYNNLTFRVRENESPDTRHTPCLYKFPVAYLENKPVFVGDKIYSKEFGNVFVIDGYDYNPNSVAQNYSWNPPKPKTFMLNGVEFVAPDNARGDGYVLTAGDREFYFKKMTDADKAMKAIIDLLDGKQAGL